MSYGIALVAHGRDARPTARARVLFLINHPIDDPSCRFRIFQFLPYLQAAGFSCEVRPFTTSQLYHAIRSRGQYLRKVIGTLLCTGRRLRDIWRVSDYDIVVIHREVFPFCAPFFECLVTRRHSRVIFGFDDSIHIGHGNTSGLPHPFLYRLKYGRSIDAVLQQCALVTPGNRTLADYASQLNANVIVVPTVIDTEQYAPRFDDNKGERTIIGWFGSRSTSSYLSLVTPALTRLAEIYGERVGFCFYGDREYATTLPNSRIIPFSVDSELAELGKIDIGLMPLPDDPWTRGKCSLKALQYMARGVAVVTSPVGMAADVIQHGNNGFWARNDEEWFYYLNLLVSNAPLRQQFAMAGRQTVERFYSLQTWAPRMIQIFEQVLSTGRVTRKSYVAA